MSQKRYNILSRISYKRLIQYLCLFAILGTIGVVGCRNGKSSHHPDEESHDLPQIQERGELVMLTLYSSTTYFQYRGEPMGYHYELCRQFAESLGVTLKVKVANSPDELVEMLLRDEGDLIGYNLAVTNERKDDIRYCGEETITHQVIVQRRGSEALKDVTELVGKDVYTTPGKYLDRLENLNNELGGGIMIHEMPADSVTTEDLITQVATKRIDYTLCDNDIAQLNRTYYPNLDINLQVSFVQRSSWAVRKDQPLLAQAADEWYKANVKSTAFRASTKRYFEQSKRPAYGTILSVKDGKISHFDKLFKTYSKEIGWDWRLLAALAYTESNFDTTAVSWAGARGLMQLMPNTAKALGVPEGKEQNPEESVKAATKFIGIMNRNFRHIADPEERSSFILAAYNAGLGHVKDAMALAKKYGSDPNVWEGNVEKYILLKSHEQYFNDSVCTCGYFRGTETYNFVRETKQRYHNYKEKIKN